MGGQQRIPNRQQRQFNRIPFYKWEKNKPIKARLQRIFKNWLRNQDNQKKAIKPINL